MLQGDVLENIIFWAKNSLLFSGYNPIQWESGLELYERYSIARMLPWRFFKIRPFFPYGRNKGKAYHA